MTDIVPRSNDDGMPLEESEILGASYRAPFWPLEIASASGSTLTLRDGRTLLDAHGMAASVLIGYANAAVSEAITAALSGPYQVLTALAPGRSALALGRRLIHAVPGEHEKRVWYGTSGSTAVDAVSRMACRLSGRSLLVSFEGAHHGITAGASALSGDTRAAHELKTTNVVFAPYPYPYRCRWGPCDPVGCSLECLSFLDRHLSYSRFRPEEVAAIVIEVVQSSSGEIVPPPNYLPALRRFCDEHGVLLIVDEVKTGLGRTGRMFAVEHSGIVPDAVVLGKGLGGGLPLAAIVARRDLLDGEFMAEALSGSAAACAAAMVVLDEVEKSLLDGRISALGDRLLSGIRDLTADHHLVGDVRGLGLMAGIEIVTDRVSAEPSRERAQRLGDVCLQGGLLVRVGGLHGNVVSLTPPLTTSERELESMIAVLALSLDRVADEPLPHASS